jgi:hypothetical protein
MPEKSEKKSLQRIILIAVSVAFLGTMVFPIVQMLGDSSQPSNNAATPDKIAIYEQLQEKAKGYDEVLKREPNNPMALNELAKTRYQMYQLKGDISDLKEMVEPLEKLVKLYPEQKELTTLLGAIEQQVAPESQPQKPTAESQK